MFVLLLLILQRSIELQRPLPLYRICVLKQLSVERQSCQILGEKTLSSGVLESFLLDAPFSGAVIFPARFSTFFLLGVRTRISGSAALSSYIAGVIPSDAKK